jgi:hypothetical protein
MARSNLPARGSTGRLGLRQPLVAHQLSANFTGVLDEGLSCSGKAGSSGQSLHRVARL